MNTLCYCCSDVRHYRQTVEDVKRISLTIDRIIPADAKEDRNFHPLSVDRKHITFMCGSCQKVGDELMFAQMELEKVLRRAYTVAKTSQKTKNYVLRLLQGFYPVTYRAFQRA